VSPPGCSAIVRPEKKTDKTSVKLQERPPVISYLLVTQLLAQRRQQMPELSRRYKTARILVKMTQPFDEIIGRITRSLLRNGLIDGQEHLERNAFVRFQLVGEFFHIRFGRILAQSTQAFANLLLLDFAIASVVEEVEGFLEFCAEETRETM
jgi:hypothetical protein